MIGHEMGHVGSGHAVYQTLLQRLTRLSGVLTAIPLGGLGIRAILAAFLEWSRKSEPSADRAGLLATQDPAVAFRVHMKLASGGHLENLDATSFFAQATEYNESSDLRDSVLKLLLVEARSHPFAVVRAGELRRWVDDGDFTRILGGNYLRRADDNEAGVSEAAQEAARTYAENFRQSQDTMAKLMGNAATTLGAVSDWVGAAFKGRDDGEGPAS